MTAVALPPNQRKNQVNLVSKEIENLFSSYNQIKCNLSNNSTERYIQSIKSTRTMQIKIELILINMNVDRFPIKRNKNHHVSSDTSECRFGIIQLLRKK